MEEESDGPRRAVFFLRESPGALSRLIEQAPILLTLPHLPVELDRVPVGQELRLHLFNQGFKFRVPGEVAKFVGVFGEVVEFRGIAQAVIELVSAPSGAWPSACRRRVRSIPRRPYPSNRSPCRA